MVPPGLVGVQSTQAAGIVMDDSCPTLSLFWQKLCVTRSALRMKFNLAVVVVFAPLAPGVIVAEISAVQSRQILMGPQALVEGTTSNLPLQCIPASTTATSGTLLAAAARRSWLWSSKTHLQVCAVSRVTRTSSTKATHTFIRCVNQKLQQTRLISILPWWEGGRKEIGKEAQEQVMISVLDFLDRLLLVQLLLLDVVLALRGHLPVLWALPEAALQLQEGLVAQQEGAPEHADCNCYNLHVGGYGELAGFCGVAVGLHAIVEVDEEDEDVDRVDELAPHVLEGISEGLEVADVSQEGATEEGVDDSTRDPVVDDGKQEAQDEPVDDGRDDVPGLHLLLLELVDVLPELLLARGHLRHSDHDHHRQRHQQTDDREGVHLFDVLDLNASGVADVEHVEDDEGQQDFLQDVLRHPVPELRTALLLLLALPP